MLPVRRVWTYETGLPQGEGQEAGLGKKRLTPAPNVKHERFVEHRVQADVCGCAFEARKRALVYQVMTCQFCGSVHIDKGKFRKFNHISHKC